MVREERCKGKGREEMGRRGFHIFGYVQVINLSLYVKTVGLYKLCCKGDIIVFSCVTTQITVENVLTLPLHSQFL